MHFDKNFKIRNIETHCNQLFAKVLRSMPYIMTMFNFFVVFFCKKIKNFFKTKMNFIMYLL